MNLSHPFLLLLITFTSVVVFTRGSDIYYITPSDNVTCACPAATCITLNSYAEMSNQERNNNSMLIFMPGVHYLGTSLSLDGLFNITLKGAHNLSSRIVIEFVNITITNSERVLLHNLVFESTESAYTNMTVMSLVDSIRVSLSNVKFHGNNLMGQRALEIVSSRVNLTDTLFTSYTSDNGGAIKASNCILAFDGNNSFMSNTASDVGGAMSIESCEVNFRGETTFLENRASLRGGAILASGNSCVTFEGVSNFRNNSIMALAEYESPSTGGGAVALITSHMIINGSISFDSNAGPNGGALLTNRSIVSSQTGSRVMLRNNMATWMSEGGETNSHSDHTTANTSCTTNSVDGGLGGSIYLDTTEIQLDIATFENNSARCGGSIYGLNSELTLSGTVTATFSMAKYDGGTFYLNHTSLVQTGTLEIAQSAAHVKGSAMYLYKTYAYILSPIAIRDCFQTQDMDLDGTVYLEYSNMTFSGHTTFSYNSALEGGALYALDSTIRMSNRSTFIGNRASLNGGALYLERSRIALLDVFTFQSNTASVQGGGVYGSIGSVIFLTGQAVYRENGAGEGGVFAMENGVSMVLSSPLHVTAVNNTARTNGGVMFYTDVISTTDCATRLHSSLRPLPVCFLELNSTLPFNLASLNIRFNFTQNKAGSAGSVLYGGTLSSCRMLVSETLDLNLLDNKCEIIEEGHYEDNPFQIIMSISDPRPDRFSIGSVPLRICFCVNGTPDCERSESVRVRRGETFQLSAVTVGQANGPTPSTIRTDIDNSVEINSLQQTQKTTIECTDIFYKLFTTRSSFTLVLYPDGPCRDTGIARKEVQVTLLPCPDGFDLSYSQTECVCEDRLVALNATCNIDTRGIEVDGGKWLKAVYDENGSYTGLIVHPYCPFDYCVDTPTNVTLNDTDVLCNYNRTGWLCGSCRANYSLALASFHCLECSNNYLILLIPFVLAGILLVVFLLAFDLTIAKGTINGLILYANIVQANKAVFLPKNERNILTVFIAWLNLDLGIESCFFNGLTAYQHTWLQYAFPLYLWLLIGLIALFSHKSRRVSKLLGTNPVAVLATLLLMSYAKVLQTIICALNRTYLDTPTGLKAVWTYDGNVEYFHSMDHILLASVAIVALIFLFLPFSFLLMFGWMLQYHSDKKLFSWINKIKPFMDTIYGPFRTETRCWTGLLLLIRCILFLTFTFNGLSPNAINTTSINLLAISSVFAGLAVLAWLKGRVYNAWYADMLEAISILNISIFAAATYHVKFVAGNQAILAYISISIAFVIFIGVVIFHAYLRLENTTFWKRLRVELTLRQWCGRLKSRVSNSKKMKEAEDKSESVEMSQEPTTSYVTLREPLLES